MASQPHEPPHENVGCRARVLEEVLRADRARLLRHARYHSERAQDAEDAVADACVRFLRAYEGPARREDALRWLLFASRRCAWTISRRRRRRERLHPSVAVEETERSLVDLGGDPAEAAERRAEVEQVGAAIARLSPQQREALILFGLGCSYREIGRLRGWSLAKVNRLINDGRARVRRILEEGDASS